VEVTKWDESEASNAVSIRMGRTIRLAETSDMRQQHGAILFQGGRILSLGVNVLRNPPMHYIPYDAISNHAEIAACRGLSWRNIRRATLYIARLRPGGDVGDSKPCNACMKYLSIYTNITKIVHT